MTQLREGRTETVRPVPDEVELPRPSRWPTILRAVGALSVLVVGAVHLEQYFAEHFNVVPIIGPLFALNFVGATLIGLGLLVPGRRMRPLHLLLSLGGIGLAATAFVFLFVSEHQPLFGFQDYGFRTEIVIALAGEAAAVVALTGYLVARLRRDA